MRLKKLKLIAKIFNSSSTIDDFKVNLDLHGITIDEASKIYSIDCKECVKYMKGFCCNEDGHFSWEMLFKHSHYIESIRKMHMALPYKFIVKSTVGEVKYHIESITPSGNKIEMRAQQSKESIKDLMCLHSIDATAEMFSTLLYEISCEMSMMR